MLRWFSPSWNGDHRLESVKPGESCRLTVISPTPHETKMLGRFLDKLVRRGILQSAAVPESELLIPAPIGKVAPLLVKEAKPKRTTITAVRYENGKLEIVEGTGKTLVELGERLDAEEKASATGGEAAVTGGSSDAAGGVVTVDVQKVDAKKIEEKPEPVGGPVEEPKDEKPSKKGRKPKAAASVSRPTMSCPACAPGSIAPASEVLLEFLTPEQHETWAKDRVVEVEGHLSGHRYLVAHRHSRLANRWGRVCFDSDDQAVLHFHDQGVPPEEEVLAAVLILGSREPWLRNEASCFRGGFTSVFKNPFGDVTDGVEDAALTTMLGGLGRVAAGFLGH